MTTSLFDAALFHGKWCARCILRFAGIEAIDRSLLYTWTMNEPIDLTEMQLLYLDQTALMVWLQAQTEKSISWPNMCSACCNLLQDSWLTTILYPALDALPRTLGTNIYTLSLCLPTNLEVRERFWQVHLKQDLSNQQRVVDIRPVLRFLIANHMKSNLIYAPCSSSGQAPRVYECRLTLTQPDDHRDTQSLCLMPSAQYRPTKKLVSRLEIEAALRRVSDQDIYQFATLPPVLPSSVCLIENAVLKHESIYFAGRYIKQSRNMSQTDWIVAGQSLAPNSVGNGIAIVLQKELKASSYNFMGAGREDADVRMLGRGRPFLYVAQSPSNVSIVYMDSQQRQVLLREWMKAMNSNDNGLIVTDLCLVDGVKANAVMSASQETKTKSYLCPVVLDRPIHETDLKALNAVRNLDIIQRTPLRVLQRRSLANRTKRILALEAVSFPNRSNTLLLRVTAQAGTYIKEFIHGDLKRTKPSLADLLPEPAIADIVSLDVVDVDMEWPLAEHIK